MFLKKNKSGLSQVVEATLLIALTIGIIAGVWAVVNSFVADRLDKTGSCYKILGKTSLGPSYTCYNETGNYILVNVIVGEAELESLFLAIEIDGESQVYELNNDSRIIPNIRIYNSLEDEVRMPGPESAKTYIINAADRPTRVQLAPRAGGTTCDVSDYLDSIATCI
ncbi:hypothetical protein JXM83_00020 [Candidatus Woesearchaeota archaeon]|nr:hypothetical protein [Candidatus Woesearchaeota archaeon]